MNDDIQLLQLNPPSDVTVNSPSPTEAQLTWTEVEGAESYRIYRSTTATGPFTLINVVTGTTYLDMGLVPGTTYYYTISTFSEAEGEGEQSAPVSVTLLDLTAPTNVTATATSDTQINVAWNEVEGATSYDVYRATAATGPFTLIVNNTDTTYSDNGLDPDTTYFYQIRARNAEAVSDPSALASATTQEPPVPSVPTGLRAIVTSPTSVTIDWQEVNGATGYRLYRATMQTGPYELVTDTTETSYSDEGLLPNTLYFYTVLAYNDEGNSAQSTPISVTTEAIDAPTNLVAQPLTPTSIELSWDAVTPVDEYVLYRADSPNGPFIPIYEGDETTFVDTGLTPNTTYYYRVASRFEGVLSELSEVVPGTTLPDNVQPTIPTNLLAVQIRCQLVRLTWMGVLNATAYRVYRATSLTGPFTLIGTSMTPSFIDATAMTNITYYYQVTAIVGGVETTPSMAVSITLNRCFNQRHCQIISNGGRLYRCCYTWFNDCCN